MVNVGGARRLKKGSEISRHLGPGDTGGVDRGKDTRGYSVLSWIDVAPCLELLGKLSSLIISDCGVDSKTRAGAVGYVIVGCPSSAGDFQIND